MNSVQNSDSEQYPESRLGLVHRVYTLNPGCAPTTRAQRPGRAHGVVLWRALGHIVALSRSFRWHVLSCRCAHARAVAPCCSSPQSRYKIVSQHKPLPLAHCASCRLLVSQRPCAVSQPVSLPILRHKGHPKPRYKPLYRDLPLATLCARRSPLRVRRSCRGLSQPYRRAFCWPYRGPLAVPRQGLSRYKTVYRDSITKMGSSPFQFTATSFFFFTLFFFICSTYWKTIKKKILIFFPVLHTIKPQKKFLQYTFFFLCAIHQAHNFTQHNTKSNHISHFIHQNAQGCII